MTIFGGFVEMALVAVAAYPAAVPAAGDRGLRVVLVGMAVGGLRRALHARRRRAWRVGHQREFAVSLLTLALMVG
jgi:hypothetical protein